MHIIIQLKHLLREWRVIGQNTSRIVVNMQTIRRGFYSNRLIFIRNDPMKLSQRKLWAERSIYNIDSIQQFMYLFHGSTLPQNPWNQLKLCHIFFAILHFGINRISNKVKTCDPYPFLIDSIVIQRIICCYMCHSNNPIMGVHLACMTKTKRIITGCHRNLIAVRKFIIQCSSKIEIFCFISCSCTHNITP